jgi:DNA invertase Pin-like site-specific DNA recombinase
MGRAMKNIPAVAYYRTSSAANAGLDKDSERRQGEAVAAYARQAGYRVVEEFRDPAVSGADPIETRPGFAALLDRIEGNGVRTVLVEDASRFARDLVTQELGIVALVARGVRVLTSGGEDLTATDDPFKVAMRQIAGAFAQLEKARLVAKLRHARERKRATTGRCEGRPPVPARVVEAARRLARANPRTHERRSLRQIAEELARLGHLGPAGKPYFPASVARMLRR